MSLDSTRRTPKFVAARSDSAPSTFAVTAIEYSGCSPRPTGHHTLGLSSVTAAPDASDTRFTSPAASRTVCFNGLSATVPETVTSWATLSRLVAVTLTARVACLRSVDSVVATYGALRATGPV